MGIKKTMTFNLTEAEMDVLEAMSKKRDLSKTALLRQAFAHVPGNRGSSQERRQAVLRG